MFWSRGLNRSPFPIHRLPHRAGSQKTDQGHQRISQPGTGRLDDYGAVPSWGIARVKEKAKKNPSITAQTDDPEAFYE